jgi:hypothetical protein
MGPETFPGVVEKVEGAWSTLSFLALILAAENDKDARKHFPLFKNDA